MDRFKVMINRKNRSFIARKVAAKLLGKAKGGKKPAAKGKGKK